jgi:hypothetical protein
VREWWGAESELRGGGEREGGRGGARSSRPVSRSEGQHMLIDQSANASQSSRQESRAEQTGLRG